MSGQHALHMKTICSSVPSKDPSSKAGTLGLDPPGWEAGVAGRCSQPTRSRGVGPCLGTKEGARELSARLEDGPSDVLEVLELRCLRCPLISSEEMQRVSKGPLVQFNFHVGFEIVCWVLDVM